MKRIGPFEIVAGPIAGGFGEVYQVFDRDSGDEFALKTLKSSFVPGSVALESFRREIEVWVGIPTHPNVVRAIKAFEHAGRPYVLVEWIGGGSVITGGDALHAGDPALRAIDGGGVDVLEFLRQIADGMAHLHELNLVHGDLKPANIMLRARSPQITDFGFARIAGAEAASKGGTRRYLAPELASRAASPSSDIYAAGVTFVEILDALPRSAFGRNEACELAQRMQAHNVRDRPVSFVEVRDSLAGILREAPFSPSIPVHAGERLSWGERTIADALPARRRFDAIVTKLTSGRRTEAIEDLHRFAADHPTMSDARIQLAHLLLVDDKLQEAASHLNAARLHTQDRSRRLTVAALLAEARQFDDAIELLTEIENKDGFSAESWHVRARIADRSGNLSDAIDAYRHALDLGGGNDLRYALGCLLKESGLLPQAIAEFSAIGPDDRDYGVKVAVMLARIFGDTCRYDDAVDQLMQCLSCDIGAERAYIYCELGYCFKEQGLYEAAIKAYESSFALDPDPAAQEGIQLCREALARESGAHPRGH